MARVWERSARLSRQGKLTPDVARAVITAGVSDVFAASNGEALPGTTIKDWCALWLAVKKIETEPSTFQRYSSVLSQFLRRLGPRVERDLTTVRTEDIAALRDNLAKDLSRSSANIAVKILRVCLGAAVKRSLLTSNPAAAVDTLRNRGDQKRRPFTTAEIKRVYSACHDDEWRGLVLFGLYTGQRLGDLARLTWRALDLEAGTVALTTGKTGRRMILPLAKPLVSFLTELPANDDPDKRVFPKAASARSTGTLSNRFYDIMKDAGLVEPRTHKRKLAGRAAARATNALSFHCLRHTATTFLKAAGVSDALAREIIGHESEAVNRNYTHLGVEDLRKGIDRLPNVLHLP